MTPSINRMIKLLGDDEQKVVDKQKVIMMEGSIIRAFNFEFGFISPLPFLERYLHLVDHMIEKSSLTSPTAMAMGGEFSQLSLTRNSKPSIVLTPTAFDILKFAFSRGDLIRLRPESQMATCILIVA